MSKPKESPVVFCQQMVQALLAGRKTQLVAPIKWPPRPYNVCGCGEFNCKGWMYTFESSDDQKDRDIWPWMSEDGPRLECHYGNAGDRLWVKESWRFFEHPELFDCIQYRADGFCKKPRFQEMSDLQCHNFEMSCDGIGCSNHRWKPARIMPRWAKRAVLEIADVRCDYIDNMSDSDFEQNGLLPAVCGATGKRSFRKSFENYFISNFGLAHLNIGTPVWIVDFKVLELFS